VQIFSPSIFLPSNDYPVSHHKDLNMLKNISLSLLLAVCISSPLWAQTFDDARRFSDFRVGGTARSMGAGGAMGALGADFSVLSTNPAGLAWFRRSRFVVSPSVYNARTNSTLLNDPDGGPTEEVRTNFNLNAFGVVFASPKRAGDWRTVNVALGLNRLANFNQDYFFEGSSVGSIIDRFQNQANTIGLTPFESGLAFDAGALYDFDEDGFINSDLELAPNAELYRSQSVDIRGAINELVFSIAGNYKDKLMVGATVGVPFARYELTKEYREEDRGAGEEGNVPFFNALSFNEQLLTTGTGINLKLGMVFRANQLLRLGAAVHTPTAFRFNDDFSTSMGYNFTEDGNTQNFSAESDELSLNYRLSTPWRFIGSAGLIIKKHGFISAEVERVNYANNSFTYEDAPEEERAVNADINNFLGSAWNFRFGGEYAYEIFRFRAGYGLQQSRLAEDDTFNNTISGGVGLRGKSFFLDLAYQRRNWDALFTPYVPPNPEREQLVENQTDLSQVVLTLGFTF